MDGKIVNPGEENVELSKYTHFLKEEWFYFLSLLRKSVKQKH